MSGRVVHVVEDLGIGGQERALQSWVLSQRAAGLDASVVCTRGGGPVADELKAAGVPVDVVPKLLSDRSRLAGAVVHTHGATRVLGRLAARLAKARAVVHHYHGTERFGLKGLLFEALLRADAYLACSKFVAGDVREQLPFRDVGVLYNPVDTKRFSPDESARAAGRKELGAGPEAVVILCVGRLIKDKGQGVLASAASLVKTKAPKALFVCVGEGPERDELSKSGEVKLLGARADVTPYLSACDIYVQPSLNREGLGIAALEAMSCARPVVASLLQGLPEAVGDAGVLVPPGDAGALAKEILSLIEDRARRDTLGAKARSRVVEKFSAEASAAELVALDRELLGA